MPRGPKSLVLAALLVVLGVEYPFLRRPPVPDDAVGASSEAESEPPDPPEVAIGERLFLETRFAQFFSAHAGGDVNARLERGDPVLDRTTTTNGALPGPFAGRTMNCRACHLVDEQAGFGAGNRNYSDFAERSPIPNRPDGARTAPRNSPGIVNSVRRPPGSLLHLDGEFASLEDLIRETLLGRNFGWLPSERGAAMRHVARVIRTNDGTDSLAHRFGGPYPRVFLAEAPSIPPELRLPPEYRLAVDRASDEQIVDAVSRLIAAYVESLVFDENGVHEFEGSPYDVFLRKNHLPRGARPGESDSAYARRLMARIDRLDRPGYVGSSDGTFRLHDQAFVFGPLELRGLTVFLRRPDPASGSGTVGGGAGNCVACHPPPSFTDFAFHNTGAAQSEYDAIHGEGSFGRLHVPSLVMRNAHADEWLPATPRHPRARGRFRSTVSRSRPGETDLGLWNVLGNPDFPKPQAAIRRLLDEGRADASTAALLDRSIACFKTPSLRDLGHSAPYLHTGRAATLEEVLAHYVAFSARARAGSMRNPDPRIAAVTLGADELTALAAFLRSLNEDYE